MNKVRRQRLAKWLKNIEDIKGELEDVCSEEESCFDNLPENLQSSQMASDMEEAVEQMNEAVSLIEDAIGIIQDIV